MAELTRLTSRKDVLRAIEEFDLVGRDGFLKRYEFRRSREFFVEYEGRYYDSKPILAAAFGFQYPDRGPLRYNNFSGGESVVVALGRLGFDVVSNPITYLVLAENEVQADPRFDKWQDVTGERYHFPNGYRNRIRPGREFLYYKGARRASGRAVPEYFGRGTIGSVYLDPTTADSSPAKRQWLCDIEEYRPFKKSVAFRAGDGTILELQAKDAPDSYWRNGVREIGKRAFESILVAAGQEIGDVPSEAIRPEMADVVPIVVGTPFGLLVPTKSKVEDQDRKARTLVPRRFSKRSKEIGDRAEEVVHHWLLSRCQSEDDASRIVWVAREGLTPGWDIEDRRAADPCGYEVKGTTGGRFPAIEFTANEWDAAKELRGRYHLVLVTECETNSPKIAIVVDPWGLAKAGQLSVTPMSFRIVLVDK